MTKAVIEEIKSYRSPFDYVLEFLIGGLPKNTNASRKTPHWGSLHAEAEKWIGLVADKAEYHGRPPRPFTRATVTFYRYSASEPDFDGLVSSFKHVMDGLVRAGVIVNDKPSNIGQPAYIWVKGKARNGMIRVRVEGNWEDMQEEQKDAA